MTIGIDPYPIEAFGIYLYHESFLSFRSLLVYLVFCWLKTRSHRFSVFVRFGGLCGRAPALTRLGKANFVHQPRYVSVVMNRKGFNRGLKW